MFESSARKVGPDKEGTQPEGEEGVARCSQGGVATGGRRAAGGRRTEGVDVAERTRHRLGRELSRDGQVRGLAEEVLREVDRLLVFR